MTLARKPPSQTMRLQTWLLQHTFSQPVHQWRYREHASKGDKEAKKPSIHPDPKEIVYQSDVGETDRKGHDTGHDKRHKECKYQPMKFAVNHRFPLVLECFRSLTAAVTSCLNAPLRAL